MFGTPEILIVLAVVVLFFGAKKIPELARGIGQGLNEFQDATSDDSESNSSSETNTKQVETKE